jgi:hypothetical protein
MEFFCKKTKNVWREEERKMLFCFSFYQICVGGDGYFIEKRQSVWT